MPLTTVQQAQLVQSYVAVFGSAPTTSALQSYAVTYEAGGLSAATAAMVNSNNGNNYPAFWTAGQIADKIFTNLRIDGAAANADGVTLKAIAEAILLTKGVTTAQFVTVLLNALNENTFSGTDGHSVQAATAKAAYGVNLSTGVAGTSLASAINTANGGVTADPMSKDFGPLATDVLEGGSGNDSFNGYILASGSTIQTGDKVVGGTGTDTVNITNNANTATTLELQGVENVSVKLLDSATLDAVLWSGVKQVTAVANSINAKSLSITNAQASGISYGVEGNNSLSIGFIDASGSADSVTVALSSPSATTLTIGAGIEAATVTLSGGTASLTVTSNMVSGASLTISAPNGVPHTIGTDSQGNVSFSGGSASTLTLTSTTASDQTVALGNGGATLTIASSGKKTVTGGDAADTIVLNGASGAAVVSGGGGNDTITYRGDGNVTIDGGAGNDYINLGSQMKSGDVLRGGDGIDTASGNLSLGVTLLTEISGIETLSIAPTANATLNLANATASGSLGTISLAVQSAVTLTNVPGSVSAITSARNLDTISMSYRSGAAANLVVNASGTTAAKTLTFANVQDLALRIGSAQNAVTIDADGTLKSFSASVSANGNGAGGIVLSGAHSALSSINLVYATGSGGLSFASLGTGSLGGLTTLAVTNNGADDITIADANGHVSFAALDSITLTGASAGTINFAAQSGAATALTSITLNAAGSAYVSAGAFSGTDSLTTVTINATDSNSTVNLGELIAASSLETLTITATGSAASVSALGVSADSDVLRTVSISTGNGKANQTSVYVSSLMANGNTQLESITLTLGSASVVQLAELDFNNQPQMLTISSTGTGNVVNLTYGGDVFSVGSASGSIGIIDELPSVINATGLRDSALIMASAGVATGSTAADGSITINATGSGNNILIGGTAADVINSGAGADRIAAGGGADTISAGGGADTVYAGAGNDVITLGTGSDTAVYVVGEGGIDRITDFSSADQVKLQLYTGDTTISVGGSLVTGSSAGSLAGSSASGVILTVATQTGLTVSGLSTSALFDALFSSSGKLFTTSFSASGTLALMNIGGATASGSVALIAVAGDDATVVLAIAGMTASAVATLSSSNLSLLMTLSGYTAAAAATGDFTG